MFSFDVLLSAGAIIVLTGWLVVSRRARTICRASLTHMGRGCEVCPKTFEVTPSAK